MSDLRWFKPTSPPIVVIGEAPSIRDAELTDFRNAALSDLLYNSAARRTAFFDEMHRYAHAYENHPGAFGPDCPRCFPKPTRWQRFWRSVAWWWDDHRPRVHFGPCDDGEY